MHNALKAKLRQKQVAFGVTAGIGSPEVSGALGAVGLDWIMFDTQHTPLGTETIHALIESMSYSQTAPIVRVVSNDSGLINKAFDIGAHAVVVPLVNSQEDAKRVVRASRYPPKGVRSWGPRGPSRRDAEYFATADAEVMVIPQVETELALDNLEDIVCTEGIEAVFVGPMDLSMSLGVFQQFDSPKFLRGIEKIVSTCKAHNVVPGILAPVGAVERNIKQGFGLISLGGDLALLAQNVAELVKKAKSSIGVSSTAA